MGRESLRTATRLTQVPALLISSLRSTYFGERRLPRRSAAKAGVPSEN